MSIITSAILAYPVAVAMRYIAWCMFVAKLRRAKAEAERILKIEKEKAEKKQENI